MSLFFFFYLPFPVLPKSRMLSFWIPNLHLQDQCVSQLPVMMTTTMITHLLGTRPTLEHGCRDLVCGHLALLFRSMQGDQEAKKEKQKGSRVLSSSPGKYLPKELPSSH